MRACVHVCVQVCVYAASFLMLAHTRLPPQEPSASDFVCLAGSPPTSPALWLSPSCSMNLLTLRAWPRSPQQAPQAPIHEPISQRRRQASEVRQAGGPDLVRSEGAEPKLCPPAWRAKVVGDGAGLGFGVRHLSAQIPAPTQALCTSRANSGWGVLTEAPFSQSSGLVPGPGQAR